MNAKTKEEAKARLTKHYSTWGRNLNYIQHMFDLDEEFPSVDIFGPQCISAEVGPGWNKLLRPVMKALSDHGCRAGQIKQKFGGLRFYWDYPDHIENAMREWRAIPNNADFSDGMTTHRIDPPYRAERENIHSIVQPLVAEAERLSFRTCEECGADIGQAGGPCHRTECDDCAKKTSGAHV